MKKLLLPILTLVGLTQFALCAVGDKPQITLLLDSAAIAKAKEVHFETIASSIRKFKLPDFSFKNGYLNDNALEIVGYTDENLIVTEASPKSITLKVDKVKAVFSSEDFKYKMWFIPYSGAIKAEIEDISFDVTLTPKMQTATDNKGYMFY